MGPHSDIVLKCIKHSSTCYLILLLDYASSNLLFPFLFLRTGELLLVLPVLLAPSAAAGESVERCVMMWSFIDPGHAQQGLSGKRQARGSLKGRALQGTQLRFLAHNARQSGRSEE